MTTREARKIVTIVEAVYLLQGDHVAGPDTWPSETEQASWLARSLLRRYDLEPGDVREYDDPNEIRRAVLCGDL